MQITNIVQFSDLIKTLYGSSIIICRDAHETNVVSKMLLDSNVIHVKATDTKSSTQMSKFPL